MSDIEAKGRSPFVPDQPVPVELFAGRQAQISHIMQRGVGQVATGKPVTIFLEGDYGIGKTSLAKLTQYAAERDHGLLGIYATLEGAKTLDDVGTAILKATVESSSLCPSVQAKVRDFLADFIREVNIFGFAKLDMTALKKAAPSITMGLLSFLQQTVSRVKDSGIKGVFLVLDEINGIAANPDFAQYLKATVDRNAQVTLESPTLPLLLMVCGVAQRRRQLIAAHESVARIFDVVSIDRFSDDEMREFFTKTFEDEANIKVKSGAMKILVEYSAGFPKFMHLIGNAAFWRDRDGVIDEDDAHYAAIDAADELGRKYLDQQVYKALQSGTYLSILSKIAQKGLGMRFIKNEIAAQLNNEERRKFNNFLQKMKKLRVLESGDTIGEYNFSSPMVGLYIWLQARRAFAEKHM